MNEKKITVDAVDAFTNYLKRAERSQNTIEKYRRDVLAFIRWLGNRPVDREMSIEWKQQLLGRGYTTATVNSMLIALNRFFDFMGWNDCRVNVLKQQKRLFREENRELTKEEYSRLVETAVQEGKSGSLFSWKPSVRPASGFLRCSISRLRRRDREGWRFRSKARSVRSCCRASCVKSCSNMPKTKKRFGRDISHQKRDEPLKKTNLG